MLSVSVVIPILNAERTLTHCLNALAQLDPAPLEIVLVDNGSTDGTMGLLEGFASSHKRCLVRILREPREGAAAARNAGLWAAKGEIISFIDSDCAPIPAWLSHLIKPFTDPTVGAVAGRVTAAQASTTLELFSCLYTLQLPDQPERSSRWTPWRGGYVTANLAVRANILRELKGIDEQSVGGTAAGSDYELCTRLYKRGLDIVYRPEASVMHHHRTTLLGMLRQGYDYGQSHAYLLGRCLTQGLWVELPRLPLVLPRWPFPGWIDLASADKKLLLILGLSIFYVPALFILIPYASWLVLVTSRRARRAGASRPGISAVQLAGLLILKSFAMTLGRWWGSVKYGALCF